MKGETHNTYPNKIYKSINFSINQNRLDLRSKIPDWVRNKKGRVVTELTNQRRERKNNKSTNLRESR